MTEQELTPVERAFLSYAKRNKIKGTNKEKEMFCFAYWMGRFDIQHRLESAVKEEVKKIDEENRAVMRNVWRFDYND